MVTAYPVVLKLKDFFMVFITVVSVSFIASAISAKLSTKHFENVKENL